MTRDRRVSRMPDVQSVPEAVAELTARLERIQKLTEQLAKVRGDAQEQQSLAQNISREIKAAKAALKPLPAAPRARGSASRPVS